MENQLTFFEIQTVRFSDNQNRKDFWFSKHTANNDGKIDVTLIVKSIPNHVGSQGGNQYLLNYAREYTVLRKCSEKHDQQITKHYSTATAVGISIIMTTQKTKC